MTAGEGRPDAPSIIDTGPRKEPEYNNKMKLSRLLSLLAIIQALLAARVLARMAAGARGRRIERAAPRLEDAGRVSVIVPVLNERGRLTPCLDGLIAQSAAVREILVVDGGSVDGTQDLVRAYAARDRRVRLHEASPVSANWNGKAWGLNAGWRQADAECDWLLTIDADVRPAAPLADSLLAHARATGLGALSVATLQDLHGLGEGLLHPAMLTTLVYRFGIPGGATRRVSEAQANGQCALYQRDLLASIDGFALGRDSLCEDITIARALAARGHAVGFYESDGLVSVRMYEGAAETWRNWPRSLVMRDRFFGAANWLGLAEVALVQAAPLPVFLWLWLTGRRGHWSAAIAGALLLTRLGVLAGTARAYRRRSWTYWLSPLADGPVAARLVQSTLVRRAVWRGRVYRRGEA